MTALRHILPRSGTRNLIFGSRRALHSITSLCVIASRPVTSSPPPCPTNCHETFAFSTSNAHPPTSNTALSALQDFISRLEEPEPHRKPPGGKVDPSHGSTLQGLATALSVEYSKLPPLSESQERGHVLTLLARECGSSEKEVAAAVEHYQQHAKQHGSVGHLLTSLRHACTPRYDGLFQLILEKKDGMKFLVSLRQDLLLLMESAKSSDDELLVYLKEVDSHMKNLMSTWFGPGMLEIRRITYDGTSASIIEKIATKEAVHPMRSLDDLRTRLGDDHRVFAAFHPLLPNEPLVFCHVALRPTVSSTMDDVLETHHLATPRVAVFYSISSTQAGLSGVDLGQFLLKQAISLLQQEFSTLETFVTLSPIPRFRKWLQDKIILNQGGTFVDNTFLTDEDSALLISCFGCSQSQVLEAFLHELENPSKMMGQHAVHLEPLLMKLAARYLVNEKHHGKPLDGVARFHIRNGSEMYQLNYCADTSRKGWHNSLGIMINYCYNLESVETNQLWYELDFNIPVCEGVSKWLS